MSVLRLVVSYALFFLGVAEGALLFVTDIIAQTFVVVVCGFMGK